MATVP
ncbi:hypothetical protein GQ600_2140 [Phytophthora cactorum]|jgi:hypothetical protein